MPIQALYQYIEYVRIYYLKNSHGENEDKSAGGS